MRNGASCKLLGNGASGELSALGLARSEDGGMRSIEADFYDQILYYGWVFGIMMIALNLVLLWQCVKPMFRRFNSVTYTVAMMGCVWILAAYMAGHGFSNSMLAPILGAMFVIVNNNDYDFRKVKQ